MANDLWRWADPDGQQRKVRFDELRAALAGGLIAPNTPVWRSGWPAWQPAQDVPELTSASHGGANGVVLNIPPPPLAMLAVQQQYEASSSSIAPAAPADGAHPEQEPPPPPAYVPLPVKAPSLAPPNPSSSQQLKTQLGGSAHIPAATGSSPVVAVSGSGSVPAAQGSAPRLGSSLPTAIGLPSPAEVRALGANAAAGKAGPSKPPPPPRPNDMIEELSGSMLLEGEMGSRPNNGVIASPLDMGSGDLPPPTNPVIVDGGGLGTDEGMGDDAPLGLPKRRFDPQVLFDDIKAIRSGQPPKNKPLLIGTFAGALLLFIMLVAGIISVASGTSASTTSKDKDKDKDKLASSGQVGSATPSSVTSAAPPSTPAVIGSIPPPPPPEELKAAAGPTLGDCTTAGESKTIAPKAVIQSGIEAHALNHHLALGFAPSARDAFVTSLDPSSLAPASSVRTKPIGGDARRVTPMLVGGKLAALPDVDRKGDRIAGRRVVSGNSQIDVGFAEGAIVWAPHGKDSYAKLFALEGDTPVEALRAVALSDRKGIAIAFRRGNAIHIGSAKGDGNLEADGELSKIAGLGQVGSPAIAVSGDRIIAAWADRATAQDEWKVRWAKLKIGGTTDEATPFAIPEGGLGGQAMSPSIAPLGGGKFLLAWTEGPVSNHQVRALTIGADGSPSGSPLAISASGVNAGQPAAAVTSDGRGAVAFLTAKGKAYEVHATPITCK